MSALHCPVRCRPLCRRDIRSPAPAHAAALFAIGIALIGCAGCSNGPTPGTHLPDGSESLPDGVGTGSAAHSSGVLIPNLYLSADDGTRAHMLEVWRNSP